MAANPYAQQYAQYNTNKIMSASPAELTLLLYEGAIKFCNMAIMGIEHNDIQKAMIISNAYRGSLMNSVRHWICVILWQRILTVCINIFWNGC